MAQPKSDARRIGTTTLPYLPSSRRKLASFVGSVLYYVRTRDDLIKIGFTRNIERRVHKLGTWDCLLALVPGEREDEQDLHRLFQPYRARGYEYYHPAPELLDHIDTIRERMGVSPVERW